MNGLPSLRVLASIDSLVPELFEFVRSRRGLLGRLRQFRRPLSSPVPRLPLLLETRRSSKNA